MVHSDEMIQSKEGKEIFGFTGNFYLTENLYHQKKKSLGTRERRDRETSYLSKCPFVVFFNNTA